MSTHKNSDYKISAVKYFKNDLNIYPYFKVNLHF